MGKLWEYHFQLNNEVIEEQTKVIFQDSRFFMDFKLENCFGGFGWHEWQLHSRCLRLIILKPWSIRMNFIDFTGFIESSWSIWSIQSTWSVWLNGSMTWSTCFIWSTLSTFSTLSILSTCMTLSFWAFLLTRQTCLILIDDRSLWWSILIVLSTFLALSTWLVWSTLSTRSFRLFWPGW